jgi:2-amino-4-hydroxy-6-hydroxymethyldihydropteridine diphosphokinase
MHLDTKATASDTAMIRAFVGLGSNLDDPQTQLQRALRALAELPHTRLAMHSGLYRSAPLGSLDQPDYLNAVAALDTQLSAADLLAALQAIERRQGRVRSAQRWEARTLDLDLLLYGELQLHDAALTVPHPGLRERAFVLYPLQAIAPDLIIPGLGELSALIAQCPRTDLHCLDDSE